MELEVYLLAAFVCGIAVVGVAFPLGRINRFLPHVLLGLVVVAASRMGRRLVGLDRVEAVAPLSLGALVAVLVWWIVRARRKVSDCKAADAASQTPGPPTIQR